MWRVRPVGGTPTTVRVAGTSRAAFKTLNTDAEPDPDDRSESNPAEWPEPGDEDYPDEDDPDAAG
jgi:hypothetical protein